MLSFKSGVKINGVASEVSLAIQVCVGVFKGYKLDAIVTALTDGKHSRGSLHYIGHAFDLRSRNIPPDYLDRLVKDLREALTDEFDVVVEKDHLHIEFQPKS